MWCVCKQSQSVKLLKTLHRSVKCLVEHSKMLSFLPLYCGSGSQHSAGQDLKKTHRSGSIGLSSALCLSAWNPNITFVPWRDAKRTLPDVHVCRPVNDTRKCCCVAGVMVRKTKWHMVQRMKQTKPSCAEVFTEVRICISTWELNYCEKSKYNIVVLFFVFMRTKTAPSLFSGKV